MTKLPNDQHITYQLQYRKCGKVSCGTCRKGPGHGPYWYAYWRESSRLRSGYIGKVNPYLPMSAAPAIEHNGNTDTKDTLPAMIVHHLLVAPSIF